MTLFFVYFWLCFDYVFLLRLQKIPKLSIFYSRLKPLKPLFIGVLSVFTGQIWVEQCKCFLNFVLSAFCCEADWISSLSTIILWISRQISALWVQRGGQEKRQWTESVVKMILRGWITIPSYSKKSSSTFLLFSQLFTDFYGLCSVKHFDFASGPTLILKIHLSPFCMILSMFWRS